MLGSGKPGDFSEAAQSRWPLLVRLAYGLTGDRHLAEDLARTALASACAAWSRVRHSDDPDAYLRRLLLTACRSGLRDRHLPAPLVAPPDATAAGPAGQRCDHAHVIAALQRLPRRQREVLVLRTWAGLTEPQTAAALRCPARTVKRLASGGLAELSNSVAVATEDTSPPPGPQDMRLLLRAALDDLAPGPLPLDDLLQQCTRIRARRRVTTVSLAAAAAAAAAVPVLVHIVTTKPTSEAYQVSVRPPGRSAPAGTVAAGRVNGTPWQVIVYNRPGPGEVCFLTAMPQPYCQARPSAPASHSSAPAQFSTNLTVSPPVTVGTVRRDVSDLRVMLTNGQTLTLRPVQGAGGGTRYVSFAVPGSRDVSRVSAYSAHGELGYAVPFTATGVVQTLQWLEPGVALPPTRTRLIGSGTTAGLHWTVHLYAGPWGLCFARDQRGARCTPVSLPSAATSGCTLGELETTCASAGGAWAGAGLSGSAPGPVLTTIWLVAAAPQATYVLVRGATGTATVVPVVRMGNVSYAAFLGGDHTRTHWAAYTAAGNRLAAGTTPLS